jgi:hypothetical protein
MRKLLFLAVLGGVAYGLRRLLWEDAQMREFRQRAREAQREFSGLPDEEGRLDTALRDSFPASDPPSLTPPHH